MRLLKLFLVFSCISRSTTIIPISEGLHGIFPRNADLKKLGSLCSRNSECISGAVCHVTCRCKITHVTIDQQCWKKIEPGEVGCTYDEQCQGVWPSTTCRNGECHCQEGEEIVETREGNLCVIPGNCPTNNINGALYERATHRVSTCISFKSKKEGNHFIGCDEYPEVYDCISGICCPSRGMVCIQPRSEGIAQGDDAKIEDRWFFDSITGTCQQFKYKGNGGNSNNFQSRQQCESYCVNRCQRGDPSEYNLESTASDNYQCYATEKENDKMLCCPTSAFVCSALGGVKVDKTTIRVYSSGSPRRGAEILQRFYWDPSSLSCKKFKYYGQGGNFNNFGSKKECSDYCAIGLCSIGTPLRDPSDNLQRCSSIDECPETHHCQHTICCPKPSTICSISLKLIDNCDPIKIRTVWTYSIDFNTCKSVSTSNCFVGDNHFESFEKCQSVCKSVEVEPNCPIGRALRKNDNIIQRCSATKPCPPNYECIYTGSAHTCCPSKEFTCKQSASSGSLCGMSTLQRWAYDSNSNKCIQFEYFGCNGNDNNFVTRIDCHESCHRSECPDGGDALIDVTNGQTIKCDKNDDCPSTHQCSRLLYINQTSCCPSRKWICSHDADEGVACGVPSKRFYFDPSSSTCRQFTYLGCSGNSNSFSSRQACYQYCQSASCSSSEIVYQPSNVDEPFDCSLKSCPRYYSCVKHVWNDTKNVCCGTPNFGVCPSNQHPMIEFNSQQPMTCTPNVINSCPLGFQCSYSSIRSLYFCCRSVEKIEKCLKGSRPEIWQPTAEPRFCSRDSQCASETSCYSPIPYISGLCCASVDEICPATFIYEPEKSKYEECSPLARHSCGNDGQSVCLYSDAKSRFVCCRRETRQINALAKCPPGSIIEMEKMYCDPENLCPRTHFCMKKTSDRTGICCRHPSLKRNNPLTKIDHSKLSEKDDRRKSSYKYRCPRYEKPYRINGNVTKCLTDDECPEFYSCTQQRYTNSICCGIDIDEICPTRVYPTIKVEKCFMCGVGYECHKNYCCPQKEVACELPIPEIVGINNEGEKKEEKEEEGESIIRFFYDSGTNTCRSFNYKKINESSRSDLPQNHFFDQNSCIDMCVYTPIDMNEEIMKCPDPYLNPPDHPQICVKSRKSCADAEACQKTLSGNFVCCRRPQSINVHPIMPNICGDGLFPQLNKLGSIIRCANNNGCSTRICRRSSMLRHNICCRPRPISVASDHNVLILSTGFPQSDVGENNDKQRERVCSLVGINSDVDGSCLPKLFPGERGCHFNKQCVSSTCINGVCSCSSSTLLFQRMCVSKCPIFYKNENGECI